MKTPTLTKFVTASVLMSAASLVLAGKDTGAYTLVFPDGKTLSGKQKLAIGLAPGQSIAVRGKYNEFIVYGDTFAVSNFALTAADSLTSGVRTPLFAQRVPLHGQTLLGNVTIEMNNEQLVLTRSGGGITMKIQAKDISQGGMFQMEPSRTIDLRHVLAPGFLYSVDRLNRVLLSNGDFFVRESPETATLKLPAKSAISGATESIWTVTAGGRMGIVVGEDATQP